MTPKFSVILPTHNGEEHISHAISSVKCQTYDNYELIVVCDACTDDTVKAVENMYIDNLNDPHLKIIKTDYQRDGLARNAGLDAATGDWILFIDDDDLFMHEYCFQLLADQIQKERDIDVLDFAFIWKGRGYKIPSRDECFVMVWCRAWRRKFIGNNRFDDTPYGSDKHFFQHMIQNNPDVRISFFNSPIYYYNYMREGSLSWMEKQKTLLDIIVTHYDEPWDLGKPFFDMLQHQRCADLSDISVTLVQDGSETALPWNDLLKNYTFPVKIITIPHSGPAAARNAGIASTHSDWIMFCNFDDMFSDVCSVSMILRNFPTDEYDIIWSKLVRETRWYTGVNYLNRVDGVSYTDTDAKMYRRQFLNDHNIRFNTESRYHYDTIFNTVALSECDPWRIANMTTDFYPYIKTFRPDSTRHTLTAFDEARTDILQRDLILINEMQERNNQTVYNRIVAKALMYPYFEICQPDTLETEQTFDPAYIELYCQKKHILRQIMQTSDFDVIRTEIETEVMNLIQSYYNEHKLEYYLRNDGVPFDQYLAHVDTVAGIVTNVNENSTPEPVKMNHTVPSRTETKNERKNYSQSDHNRQERIVVYCGTYEVYLNMIASAKSLLCNTPVDHIFFLTEDDTFPYELPDIITNINVKNQTFFPPDGPNYDNAWTYMCMIRAAFPEYFPQYSKILSLDIDVVVNEDISQLWNYDISDYYLAGVPERQRQKKSDDPMYINFGVVMMNLDKLRADNLQPRLIHMLNTQKLGCPEQDAYNKLCANHILELPADYNYTAYSHITGETQHEKITHYAGQKFWRHYSNVKQYANLDWNDVLSKQHILKNEQNE